MKYKSILEQFKAENERSKLMRKNYITSIRLYDKVPIKIKHVLSWYKSTSYYKSGCYELYDVYGPWMDRDNYDIVYGCVIEINKDLKYFKDFINVKLLNDFSINIIDPRGKSYKVDICKDTIVKCNFNNKSYQIDTNHEYDTYSHVSGVEATFDIDYILTTKEISEVLNSINHKFKDIFNIIYEYI